MHPTVTAPPPGVSPAQAADLAVPPVRSNKNTAGQRHQVSWRAVNGICERVLAEAMGRVDLLERLIAIAIDEVKSKKAQRYLTVVSEHFRSRRSGGVGR
jgi:hypothetical protein